MNVEEEMENTRAEMCKLLGVPIESVASIATLRKWIDQARVALDASAEEYARQRAEPEKRQQELETLSHRYDELLAEKRESNKACALREVSRETPEQIAAYAALIKTAVKEAVIEALREVGIGRP